MLCNRKVNKLKSYWFLCADDWLSDQYRWINQGVHSLPKKEPLLKKSYFQLCTPDGPSKEFTRHAYQLLSANSSDLTSMITDEEVVAIVNAVAQVIPQVPQLRCWNHTFRAVMVWLRKHGAPCQDISVYLSDISDLFHLPTEEEYTSKLTSMKQRWSPQFSEYYTNHIHPDIQSIAQWAIEP